MNKKKVTAILSQSQIRHVFPMTEIQYGGLFMKIKKMSALLISLSTLAVFTQACSGGGGGGAGAGTGTEPVPPITYTHHAFYIGCDIQSSCSQFRLYQLKEGETVATKIGSIDSIEAIHLDEQGLSNIAVINDKVYYAGATTLGSGIFVFDPKLPEASGTNPFKIDLENSASNFVAIGNILYFSGTTTAEGSELMQFDTTQAVSLTNPKVVADLKSGASSSSPYEMVAIDGKLYFAANVSNGIEPYVYDPLLAVSSTNPKEIFDVNPSGSGNSSFPKYFTGMNGKIYFRAYRAAEGNEIFAYDPAIAASSTNPLVIDLDPGTESSAPLYLTANSGKLYFRGQLDANSEHRQLFVLDSTAAISGTNPSLVYDLNGSSQDNVTEISKLGKYIYFSADDSSTYQELYILDTTSPTSSTNPVVAADLFPTASTDPRKLRAFGNTLTFVGTTNTGNIYIYTIDLSNPTTFTQIQESNTSGLGDYIFDLVDWAEAN
jgi:ELWxxDGT repeat protein